MHASSSYQDSGSKVTKIAIITALHVAMALALINMKVARPSADEKPPVTVTLRTPPAIIEQPVEHPIEAPSQPRLFVPHTELVQAPTPEPLQATSVVPPVAPTLVVARPQAIVTPPIVTADKPVARKVFEVASAGNCAIPNYPASSARNGDTGTVGLALLIAPDGSVADSKITSSSGFRELDRAAVAALSSCRFKAATTNGVPEAAWGKIAYIWTLD